MQGVAQDVEWDGSPWQCGHKPGCQEKGQITRTPAIGHKAQPSGGMQLWWYLGLCEAEPKQRASADGLCSKRALRQHVWVGTRRLGVSWELVRNAETQATSHTGSGSALFFLFGHVVWHVGS